LNWAVSVAGVDFSNPSNDESSPETSHDTGISSPWGAEKRSDNSVDDLSTNLEVIWEDIDEGNDSTSHEDG